MKLLKSLILILVLSLSVQASGFGLKAQCIMNDVGPGLGAGILGKIDLSNIFFLYPNMDFWYCGESHTNRYWNHDHWVYYNDRYYDYYAYEFAFNIDGAFIFPVRPVQPYLGLGLAPVITHEDWVDSYDDYMSVGFNMFGGILFPMGSYTGMFELRGKFGNSFNVFKMAFGIIFDSPRGHSYYYRK